MVMNEENIGSLEAAALKRKERLAALKSKIKDGHGNVKPSKTDDSEELPTPKVLFRNYQPDNEGFKEAVLPQVEPSKIETLIEDQLKNSISNKDVADVEIESLAPKKVTYDLRRGIQSSLDRLERRTDRSVAELIRQRLKEGRQQDFVLAVNSGASATQKARYPDDSDDD